MMAPADEQGLPDFSWFNIPKREKIYQITAKNTQMGTKYTKWPQNIPNGGTVDPMAKNIPTSSIARPSNIHPNWDFWSENMPSGNPADELKGKIHLMADITAERARRNRQ
jgi:hypothetical protein